MDFDHGVRFARVGIVQGRENRLLSNCCQMKATATLQEGRDIWRGLGLRDSVKGPKRPDQGKRKLMEKSGAAMGPAPCSPMDARQ